MQQEKYHNALHALHTMLTRARCMAHAAHALELAHWLDAAEILPKYLAQPEDATEEFRATVEEISQQCEDCAPMIKACNQHGACTW